MNEKSLQKNLANMERELVNLQTAHEIGLGVVEYHEYKGVSSSQVQVFRLDIIVADGERSYPFLEILMRKRNNVITETIMLWQNNNDGRNFSAYCYGLGTSYCDWKITSTSALNITEVPINE